MAPLPISGGFMALVVEVSGGLIWREDYGSATSIQVSLAQRAL